MTCSSSIFGLLVSTFVLLASWRSGNRLITDLYAVEILLNDRRQQHSRKAAVSEGVEDAERGGPEAGIAEGEQLPGGGERGQPGGLQQQQHRQLEADPHFIGVQQAAPRRHEPAVSLPRAKALHL